MSTVTIKQMVTIELTEQEAKVLNAALERTFDYEKGSTLVDLSIALDDAGIKAADDVFFAPAKEEDSF